MSDFELISLISTAFGHLLIIISILYMVKTLKESQKANHREKVRDTKEYLESIDKTVSQFYRKIDFINPNNSEEAIRNYLNLLEFLQYSTVNDYYDVASVENYFLQLKANIFKELRDYILEKRIENENPIVWISLERAYNKLFKRDC